jgi:hypothetical protein
MVEPIETPILRKLYAYWDNVRGDRALPAWRDFDVHHLSFIVPNMLLMEVHRDPLRFRFRVHGHQLAWRIGYDMTGRFVDEMPHPENRAVMTERCRWLVENARPYLGRQTRIVGGRLIPYEVVWLPLADDGREINLLLGGLEYLDDPAQGGRVF